MNKFEQFLVEFLFEARGGRNTPHFYTGSNRPGGEKKRATGYGETERPGEDRIKALQDKMTKHYQENPDDADAEAYLTKGANWVDKSPRTKYGSRKKKK